VKGGKNMELIKRFIQEEEGQGLVEYALIAALIAVVCVAALQAIGTNANTKLTSVKNALT
jgi:pilus assembly protein Flp/PilA